MGQVNNLLQPLISIINWISGKIPMEILLRGFLIITIILVITNFVQPSRVRKQFSKRKKLGSPRIEEKVKLRIAKLKRFKTVRKIYELQIHRMVVLNNESRDMASKKLEARMLKGLYISVASGALTYVISRSFLIAFISALVTAYTLTTNTLNKSEKKMNKLEVDFPVIIQHFLDDYIITKNIRSALKNITDKTTGPLHNVFSTVVREIYSGVDESEAFEKAAETIGFYYAYAFADILTMAEEVGDITEPMNYLSSIIRDEIEVREKARTMNFENKMMNRILNSLAVIGVLYNMVKFDFAKSIYFYTSKGNALLIFWFLQYAITSAYNKVNER